MKVNKTLVDAHLVGVPGLGAFTARSLAGGNLENLGRQTDGALDAQVLALGALDNLGADLLEDVDLAGREGDADLVGLGSLAKILVSLVVGHDFRCMRLCWVCPSRLERGGNLDVSAK